MGSLPKRLLFGILGVALTLGFWTVKGWMTTDANATVSHIPDKVWDGGAGKVVVEAETTEAARVSLSFENNSSIDDPGHKVLETWERVSAGLHTWVIDVPAGVSGTAEVDVDAPKVGSRVRIAVKVDGRTAAEDTQVLNEPLRSGYAFFAQVALEDYAKGVVGND
jgi:uncharacterized protein YqfA (UPF0365 family)